MKTLFPTKGKHFTISDEYSYRIISEINYIKNTLRALEELSKERPESKLIFSLTGMLNSIHKAIVSRYLLEHLLKNLLNYLDAIQTQLQRARGNQYEHNDMSFGEAAQSLSFILSAYNVNPGIRSELTKFYLQSEAA